MTAIRLMSLPMHGALEMVTGLTLMGSPFAVGFSPAATVVSVLVGGVFVALALAAAAVPETGRGTLRVSTQHLADYGMTVGLFGAATIVAAGGDDAAAITMTVIAVAQLLLNLTTRYSLRG
jgi:hypothetical protein